MLLVGFDWRSSHLSCCTIPQIDRDMLDPRWLYPPFRYHIPMEAWHTNGVYNSVHSTLLVLNFTGTSSSHLIVDVTCRTCRWYWCYTQYTRYMSSRGRMENTDYRREAPRKHIRPINRNLNLNISRQRDAKLWKSSFHSVKLHFQAGKCNKTLKPFGFGCVPWAIPRAAIKRKTTSWRTPASSVGLMSWRSGKLGWTWWDFNKWAAMNFQFIMPDPDFVLPTGIHS